jgi:hypothetical protein
MTPPITHEAAREIARNSELFTLTPERLGEMLAYISQAELVEKDLWKARAERDLLRECFDSEVEIRKNAEKERDELMARAEKVLRALQSLGDHVNLDGLIAREDNARLAAVLREWGCTLMAACLDAKAMAIGGDYEAARKALAEALK